MLKRILCVSLLAGLIPASLARGQQEPPKGNLHPNFRLSFIERFRYTTWDNTIFLSDAAASAYSFTRNRTSIMGQWLPRPQLELALKLTNEFRHYFTPERREFTLHEIFVDQLYARWSGNRVNVTVGRQDMWLGEGFVVADGGPMDGSRSGYFNAVRLDVKPCPKGTITLFYFYQPEIEQYLPVVHDEDQLMVEQPEEGFGVYISRDINRTNLQAYIIRKNIHETALLPITSEINTLGARLTCPLSDRVTLTGEAAYQFGTLFGAVDRSAYGGYAYADYMTDWPEFLPSQLTAGGILLSGDDPATTDWEGWDPLFSRWPKWSESYIYTLIIEHSIAYWSNFISLYGQAHFDFDCGLALRLDYQHLMAPQPTPPSFIFGGGGKIRGDLFAGRLLFKVNRRLSGNIIWEHFRAGDFYYPGTDPANWLRLEMTLKVD
ncbi:MAG: hypothetical protein JSW34_04620 [Candidatus Zixiibacteriota bacterium]|nr:MAG: hypothetical protein JSW34_04620 [candidate division Zixibacteria bacterium]